MSIDVTTDRRLDPRVAAFLAAIPPVPEHFSGADPTSREALLAEANTPEARAQQAMFTSIMEVFDSEDVAPSTGLRLTELDIESQPDGNTIRLRIVRPDDDTVVPCVYYIHGGGMMTSSCYDGNYRSWARMIARNGVAVVAVDFRNCLTPSSVPDVAPFPAGLNDCTSGLRWVHANAAQLGIDPSRIVVSGESGGGNLTLATGLALLRDGDAHLVKGLYALCPYIAGAWPQDHLPSSIENNGILLDLHNERGALAYGMAERDARNPLAWPSFATPDDVRGLPPTVILVNECDPLRDEGIEFFRLLLAAGVPTRCRQSMGTMHATEVLITICPEISAEAARDIAAFATS